jgi:hypothetical protein
MRTSTDPIDQLIPPPRPWWVRLALGLLIVGTVGAASALFGYGYVWPRPECCGSGSGSALMALSDDGEAVVVATPFFNSSGRDLRIRAATAELPGARVLDVSVMDEDQLLPVRLRRLPAVVGGTDLARIAITFVPERCDEPGREWGSLELELDVVHPWLPSLARTYALPDPVATSDDLSVFSSSDDTGPSAGRAPLATACALLDAARR